MKKRKKNPKKTKINFSLAKHDLNVANREEADVRARAGEILLKLNAYWEQQKLKLTHKRKVTPADLKEFVDRLMAVVQRECGGNPALDGFREFALALFREKGELLRLSGFNERNVLTPISTTEPALGSPELPQAMQPVQVRYTFREAGEFEALEPVRRTKMTEGFVGFVLELNRVLAVFADGGFILLGTVCNGIGLEGYPSREQYVAALGKRKKA